MVPLYKRRPCAHTYGPYNPTEPMHVCGRLRSSRDFLESPPPNYCVLQVVQHIVQATGRLGDGMRELVPDAVESVLCVYCFVSFALDFVLVVQCPHRGPPRHL